MKFKSTILSLAFLALSSSLFAQDITLPEPITTGGMPLMAALSNRQSSRSYSPNFMLSYQQISDLLWSACGYNRRHKRTIPSAMNGQEMSAFVVTPQAIYRYNPDSNKLLFIKKGDFRHAFAMQDFARNANVNIALVYDKAIQPNETYAAISIGAMSQNIYLWCSSKGLNTIALTSFDEDGIINALNLKQSEKVLLVHSVGK